MGVVVLESDVVVWVLKGRFGLVCECLDLSAACKAGAPLVVVEKVGVLFPVCSVCPLGRGWCL